MEFPRKIYPELIHELTKNQELDPPVAFPLKSQSSLEWAEFAISKPEEFLLDHAACERKASSTCLSLAMKYPDRLDFVEALIALAREELEHFHQVFRLLKSRGIQLAASHRDPYVNGMLGFCRNPSDEHLMDRLLTFAIVEARGCERFELVARVLEKKEDAFLQHLGAFYRKLSRDEGRHFGLFLRYSCQFFGEEATSLRLERLLEQEAELLDSLNWSHSLH